MSNVDKFVNEGFVDELMKSGVWDIARVKRGSREEEETINENTSSDNEEEEITSASIAEELITHLSDEVILEFVNLLHAVILNEAEETNDDEEIDEALLKTIDESFISLKKEYDLSESTKEEIMEAIVDSMDTDDLEDYTPDQVMEALMSYLDEIDE